MKNNILIILILSLISLCLVLYIWQHHTVEVQDKFNSEKEVIKSSEIPVNDSILKLVSENKILQKKIDSISKTNVTILHAIDILKIKSKAKLKVIHDADHLQLLHIRDSIRNETLFFL